MSFCVCSPWCGCGGKRTAFWSWFFPSTLWFPETKLRSSVAASIFTYWVIWPEEVKGTLTRMFSESKEEVGYLMILVPSLHSQFQDQPIVERLVLWPSIKTQLCLTLLSCYGDTHCSEQYTLHFRNTDQLVFSVNVVNYIENAYASIQAFSSTPIHFYQSWWSHHWFCVGQLLLDSLSTHSIHSLPTCTKPIQKPPPGGIGHARAKVSWFGILPDCLYLSLLEKELQVSHRETPHFSDLWKEKFHF